MTFRGFTITYLDAKIPSIDIITKKEIRVGSWAPADVEDFGEVVLRG